MNFPNKLEYLFPGKPLQPSLMFAGKAGAYPSEAVQCLFPDLSLTDGHLADF